MTSIYQPNQAEQLAILKEQTRLTGALHEAQVLQLKMWPMVLFDHILGSKFTWDPEKKTVIFTLDVPSKKRSPKLEWWHRRLKVLNAWVQHLLGEEWVIVVETTGKKPQRFRGTRNISGAIGNSPDAK